MKFLGINLVYFFRGFIGIAFILGLAWAFSMNKKKVPWKTVGIGILLQFVFAILVLKTKPGEIFFSWFNDVIKQLLGFSNEGAKFLFGNLTSNPKIGAFFGFSVLPTIIFFSSLIAVLYYLGVMQKIVEIFAHIMMKLLGTSGAETLSCSANIFVGQTEAPLMVRPYIGNMTKSELLTIMTGGFATVAGGVMAAYVAMLSRYFPDIAGHLLSASIMNAPAAIYISKIILPETEEPKTKGDVKIDVPVTDSNIVDAAANGAGQGLQLALNVGAMLLAFIALIAIVSTGINLFGGILLNNPIYKEKLFLYKTLIILGLGLLIAFMFKNKKVTEKVGKIINLSPKYTMFILGISVSIIFAFILSVIGSKYSINYKELNLSYIFGIVFSPVAWLIGIPWKDSQTIGSLMGIRLAINEFVAYQNLAEMLNKGKDLDPRSVMIATYALCGFANFSSIAIQIGGLGGMAPERRHDLAKLGMHGVLAGTLATFMSANIAGMLTSQTRLKINNIKESSCVIRKVNLKKAGIRKSFKDYAISQLNISREVAVKNK